MKIEILYPEICTLYGDKGNTMYLQKCLPDAEFVTTGLNEKPLFLKENIDMVYMCSMSEKSQELVLDRLMQYKDEIAACMKDGKALFLLVGNSMELLGDYIKREDGTRVTGLGVVPGMYSVRQAPNRFNTLIKAKFNDMTLIGYTSRFERFGAKPCGAARQVQPLQYQSYSLAHHDNSQVFSLIFCQFRIIFYCHCHLMQYMSH